MYLSTEPLLPVYDVVLLVDNAASLFCSGANIKEPTITDNARKIIFYSYIHRLFDWMSMQYCFCKKNQSTAR
ncbi:Hypothetical protein Nlim_1741 [Candidatus Nitrosarchaeum limnium SFB1]|uniref:Uncharacterized protein n=1 Tax=Candidatus Nitrosarchaeum limnium SFB1 TaxID=886738 RepID=F3KMJ1_9ARCH|nr:Hypothetical protein Nlim_1741 [Candidatus Nitrosarchaeum limnium SFB1]